MDINLDLKCFEMCLDVSFPSRELYKEQGMCIIGAHSEALKHRQSGGEIR